ncbi:RNA 2',3'-cyclic phosphodiesterase [Streptomyces aidingensis]|uniref:RNA 2',3'-cyclic phosphodiesterase n=1 Tax=Streptomyces aidingensis TaxID=910347 RepID=UPI000B8171A8|nr:RNA 2',3'-cyclic phosphodiesterase [Streptomyces aidingensis]
MRVFAALLPPTEVVEELAEAVRALRRLPGTEDFRWTGRQDWHLTLAFYGEMPLAAVGGLEERLGRAAARRAAFELWLAGGGRFGDRVLWAGVGGDRTALARLATAARAAGRKAGAPHRETRRYHPHLTLARGARPLTARPLTARPEPDGAAGPRAWAAALDGFRSAAWCAGELVLMRSEPPEPGTPGARPRYTVRSAWPLQPPPSPPPAAPDR